VILATLMTMAATNNTNLPSFATSQLPLCFEYWQCDSFTHML